MVRPDRKVTIGGLVGSVVTIVLWILHEGFNFYVPPGVEGAMVVLLTFVVSYVVKNNGQDQDYPSGHTGGGSAMGEVHHRQAEDKPRCS